MRGGRGGRDVLQRRMPSAPDSTTSDAQASVSGSTRARTWRDPVVMLMLLTVANQLCFQTWFTLINNFAHGPAGFGGREIGILQTVREIPGFLSFGAVLVLLLMREQTLVYLALAVLSLGTLLAGFFPSEYPLYATTLVFSTGFHYFEPVKNSLLMQWVPREDTARQLGRVISAESFGALAAFGLVYATFTLAGLGYIGTYAVAAAGTLALLIAVMLAYPYFPQTVRQHQHIVLRRRYWLYYVLTLLEGARRQIFVVFASFMMVERFGYSVTAITTLYLVNQLFTMLVAEKVGGMVIRFGERAALWLEYVGLAVVFTAYAFVRDPIIACGLYMIDNVFFGLAMATQTYFRKIADPADIAPTSAVAFSINHVAAVVLPATLGHVWEKSPAAVFLTGSVLAVCSILLGVLIPRRPAPGHEIAWVGRGG